MEQEVCQQQITLTNIHDIYKSDKSSMVKIEVNRNEYCIL